MTTENRSLLRMDDDALEAERRAQAMGRLSLPDTMGGLKDPCEEAAALYAINRAKEAAQLLTAELNAKKGICPDRLWYMLMDIYQAMGQHAAFEKLAMYFAKVFDTSPPSWEADTMEASGFGHNVLIIEGAAKDLHADKIKDFLAASKQLRQARLDLSRAKLDGTEEDPMVSVRRLLDILQRIRQQRVSVFLMGETQLMSDLRMRIRGAEGAHDPLWLLLFELMQWRGMEDNFEDLAVEYAQRFDRCAPGYEIEGAIAVSPEHAAPLEEGRWQEKGNLLIPPPVISDIDSEKLLEKVEALLKQHGSIRIDASRIKVFEYGAATSFARFLSNTAPARDQVLLCRPNELVRVLMRIVGAESFLSVQSRKR